MNRIATAAALLLAALPLAAGIARPAAAQPPPPPPPPSVKHITPDVGPSTGGTPVTITGSGFSTAPGATQFHADSHLFTSVSCQSSTTCTAIAPAVHIPPGFALGLEIVASVEGRRGETSSRVLFWWFSRPVINQLIPSSGLAMGGTRVYIFGGAYPNGRGPAPGSTTIRFGDTVVPAVCRPAVEEDFCEAIAPPGAGAVQVTATTPGGVSESRPFTYVTPNQTAMTVEAVAIINDAPAPPGAVVRAFIGEQSFPRSTLCGEGTVGAGGLVVMRVAAAAELPNCGTAGARVSFTIAGQDSSATPVVTFQPGGLAKITLRAGAPPVTAPMQVNGTVTRGGTPVAKASIEALVDSVICGTGIVGNGRFALSVAAASAQPGCGTDGQLVTFRVAGVPAAGSVTFTAGASVPATLTLP